MPNKVSGDSMYANKADTSLLEKSLRFKKRKFKKKERKPRAPSHRKLEPQASRVESNDIPSVSTAVSISDGRPDYRE